MVVRRATLSESEAFRNEARSAEKKKTVSRVLVTGDTPTVTAVCGFRHADGISPDA